MLRKNGETSSRGAGSWSIRQLHKVEATIDKIESKNFLARFFNRDSLQALKEQKRYIEVMIKKEKDFVAYKDLQGKHSPSVKEIVKANKALEKQLSEGEDIKYISKREENQGNQKAKRGRPKGKPRGPRKPKVIKPEELKPRRIFYD